MTIYDELQYQCVVLSKKVVLSWLFCIHHCVWLSPFSQWTRAQRDQNQTRVQEVRIVWALKPQYIVFLLMLLCLLLLQLQQLLLLCFSSSGKFKFILFHYFFIAAVHMLFHFYFVFPIDNILIQQCSIYCPFSSPLLLHLFFLVLMRDKQG